jgi:tetratricopeptide (TPR) repeat protein
LLTRLIKINAGNPQYWLYMSTVVESHKELVFCLQETLKRDSQNATARRGLMLQGELPPDPQWVIPINLQRRNWEAQYFAGQPIPGLIDKPSRLRLGLMLGAIAVLVMVVVIVVVGFNRPEVPAFIAWLQRYTPAPTSNGTQAPATAVPTTPVPTSAGGTPVFALLTPTPTALYINTPHPRTESYRSAINAFQRSDWVAAVNFLQQAVKEDPKSDLFYLLGEGNRNLKKPKEALAAYEQAITLDPRFAPAYLGRARVRLQTNPEQADAIRIDLEKAVLLDANLLEAYLELAAFKTNHKDPSGALRDLETAMRLLPTSPLPYALRARAYLALNQPELALSDARRANQMDPGTLSGYRLLAEALRANKNAAGSVDPLEIYTRYAADDAEALAWLGQGYAAMGNSSSALRTLDLALAINPQSFEVRLIRAQYFIDLKDGGKAVDELRAASALRPDAFPVSLGLGRAALINNDPSEAWRDFTAALRLAQTDTEKAQAYYWRAIALEIARQIPQALADWADLMRLPATALPQELRDSAQQHIQALNTPTPTPRPSTTLSATATVSATPTSRTATPTATVSITPSATASAVPAP